MLDEQRRSQLDGIVVRMKTDGMDDATIQAVVDDFKGKYGDVASTSPGGPGSGPGIGQMAVDAVGKIYGGLNEAASKIGSVNSKDLKALGLYPQDAQDFRTPGLSDVTGAAGKALAGTMGGIIGGATEAIGTPLVAARRAMLGQRPESIGDVASRIASGASNTGRFGMGIGEAGGRAAPGAFAGASAFGPAVTLPAGAVATGEGLGEAYGGYKYDDPTAVTQGSMKAAAGIMGLASGAKSIPSVVSSGGKGAFIDPSFKAAIDDPAFRSSIPGVVSSPFRVPIEPMTVLKDAVSPVVAPIRGALASAAERMAEKQFKDTVNQKPAKRANDMLYGKKPVEKVLAEEQLRSGGLSGKDKQELLDELEDRVDAQGNVVAAALKKDGHFVNLDAWRDLSLKLVKERLATRGQEYNAAVDLVNGTYDAYKSQYGTEIPTATMNKIKSDYFWGKGYNPVGSPTANDAMRLMGHAADDLVNQAVDDVSVTAVNAQLGDLVRARNAVRDSMTRSVGGGRLSRLVIGGIASTMAETPLMRLLLGLGGAKMTDIVNNPVLKTGMAGALLKASGKQAPQLDYAKKP